MNEIPEYAIILLIGVMIGKIFPFGLTRTILFYERKKFGRMEKRQAAFTDFLNSWKERRQDDKGTWTTDFGKISNELMLWCPDKALYDVGSYIQNFNNPDIAKIHFGNAVLRFRKTLGYKNRWWHRNRVTADQIAQIYRVSDPDAIQ